MTLDPQTIYRKHASKYHDLVLAEDHENNLLPAIESLRSVEDARILEVGAGTGRITRQLVERGAYVEAFEKEEKMLEIAREYMGSMDSERFDFHVADARELPCADGWADLAIAGWVFGHFRYWMPNNWREEVGLAMDEMNRALTPGATAVIIETLGTGESDPAPPEGLAEYYQWLEEERGCTRMSIRTDYKFADVDTAVETLGFFFGSELAEKVRAGESPRVPEVTGLWWWTK